MGNTNRDTVGCTLLFCSAQFIVTGSVPAEDLEKNATKSAFDILRAVLHGLIRLKSKNSGNTTNPWIKLELTTNTK